MELFRRYVEWENFIHEELVHTEIEEIRAENRLKLAEVRAMARAEDQAASANRKMTVTAIKAVARGDEAYVEAQDEYITVRAVRKVLSVQQESMSRTSAFISRELSRRTSQVSDRNRKYSP